MLASFTKNRMVLIGMLVLSLVLLNIPLVQLPLKWLEVFFHELSHGLAALAIGGKIATIQLNLNGSGLCTYLISPTASFKWVVTFSGYSGAVFWGVVIYLMSLKGDKLAAPVFAYLMLGMLSIVAVFWVRDLTTLLIMGVLFLLFFLQTKLEGEILSRVLQFCGISVLVDALNSPLYLIDGKDHGDGAKLASQLFLPEFFWIGVWEIIAFYGLYIVWKHSK